jgi:endoglucanase
VRNRGVAIVSLLAAAAGAVLAAAFVLTLAPTAGAAASFNPQCADTVPATRTPGNPLMLPAAPPASNPLSGANFFVDGPAHGVAAGAIAQLLGIDKSTTPGTALPSFSDSESWGQFSSDVATRLGGLSTQTQRQIQALEKIASEPESQRVSLYSEGGTPAGIFSQTQKLFCHNFTADPGSIPVITTYFLHAKLGGCPTVGAIAGYRPGFEAQIQALAQATGNRPVVFLLELDAIGSSACIAKAGLLPQWESLLKYEATTLGALPHAVAYIEGGYSDSNTPAYAAQILNASGIRSVEGFFTNDTHNNWTSKEIAYGEAISKLTHGAHFVIDTAENGNGPLLNPHPSTQGIEALCNPSGRALGPKPTTNTGVAGVDAYLWTHVPAVSSGSCGGGPPAGQLWVARAVSEAQAANGKLGPGYPSQPY